MSITWGKRVCELLDESSDEDAAVEIIEACWESRERARGAVEVAGGVLSAAESEFWRGAGVRLGHA